VNHREREFVQLVTLHQGIIHKVCSMYAADRDERKDLFQEIVLQLWRAFDSFEGRSNVSTWMYRVALNTAISRLRSARRRPQSDELSELAMRLPAPEADPDLAEKRQALYRAIEQLSEVEKAVVMLYLEEHSYEEISDIIGITVNHVGVMLNRIKGKLKKIMVPLFT
jgi:RNA polymerase sigma-70 factor (ECF subfamily)